MAVKRVALYARVSTDGQSVDNQLRELEAVAVKEGWQIVNGSLTEASQGPRDGTVGPHSIDCAKAWSGASSTW